LEKIALCATKKINILTLVLSEKTISERNKNHTPPPPLQVKWSLPNIKQNKVTTQQDTENIVVNNIANEQIKK
jgi:hypothetical protein